MSPKNKSKQDKKKSSRVGGNDGDDEGRRMKENETENSSDEEDGSASKSYMKVGGVKGNDRKQDENEEEMEWSVVRRKRAMDDGKNGVDEVKPKNRRENGNGVSRKVMVQCVSEMDMHDALKRMAQMNLKLEEWIDEKEKEGLAASEIRELLGLKVEYGGIVHGLLRENERLRGKVEGKDEGMCMVRDQIVKLCESKSRTSEGVRCLSEKMYDMDERANVIKNGGNKVSSVRGSPRSYAVIVKGVNEDLSADEVRKRMDGTVCKDVNVWVRAVRPVKGGGLVVVTASAQECRAISEYCRLGEVGLRTDQSKRLDPRGGIRCAQRGQQRRTAGWDVWEMPAGYD